LSRRKKEGETWEEIEEELGKTEIDTEALCLGDPHESGNEGEKEEKGCSVLHCSLHIAHQF
jgi:predicted transcriptional regulator